MEQDPHRDYSVLTKDDLKEKMNKQIDDLSEIFLLSKADATVLLTKLQWDSQHVSERLSENKEKLLTELGFSPAVTDSNYADNFFSVEKNLAKLTLEARDMYEEYVLRSYLEENKGSTIKQCPAPGGCGYFIEFHRDIDVEEWGLNVVCLCGHTFCGRCRLESHRPVTCNNASDWLSRDLKKLSELSIKSLSVSWIESNTKSCPHCKFSLEIGSRSRVFRFVECVYCSGRFCWECGQAEESHKTQGANADCVVPFLPPPVNGTEAGVTCVDRWEASEVALAEAKSELESFEEDHFTSQEYIRIMREGLMLIVQCRQFLKWSCVYDHVHNEYQASKREYLRFLQDCASTLVQSYSETLKEEAVKVFSATTYEETISSKWKVSGATSNIGNYFFHFTKTLQNGIDDVKVKAYDNFGGPYWLCDRCTCGNTWLDMTCKMCCARATPVEKKLRDLSLN